MSVQSKIFGLLDADTTVHGLVADRIYPGIMRQEAPLPAIVYAIVDAVPLSPVDGNKATLYKARVQVDCYAKSYDAAQTLANAVDHVLDVYTSVDFSALVVARRDLYEAENQYHRVSIDISTWEHTNV